MEQLLYVGSFAPRAKDATVSEKCILVCSEKQLEAIQLISSFDQRPFCENFIYVTTVVTSKEGSSNYATYGCLG